MRRVDCTSTALGSVDEFFDLNIRYGTVFAQLVDGTMVLGQFDKSVGDRYGHAVSDVGVALYGAGGGWTWSDLSLDGGL